MPVTEPGPIGTFCEYASQPLPTRSGAAAGYTVEVIALGAEAVPLLCDTEVAEGVLSSEHEAKATTAMTEKPAATTRG